MAKVIIHGKVLRTRRAPDSPELIFLRFGLWSAKSRNFSTNREEQGVSVYPCVVRDGVVYPNPHVEYSEQLRGSGRLAFAVAGRMVGYGSDAEPLLRRVAPVEGVALALEVGEILRARAAKAANEILRARAAKSSR